MNRSRRICALAPLVITAGITMVLGCSNRRGISNAPPQDPATLAAGASRQLFGTFSFEVPSGWSSVAPDHDKTKAMLLLGGARWQDADAMIKVDVGTPALATPQELAEQVATSGMGQIVPEVSDFDGQPAIQVTMPGDNLATPRLTIVMHRAGKAYLVMAGAEEGVDPTNAIEHIRSTWQWAE